MSSEGNNKAQGQDGPAGRGATAPAILFAIVAMAGAGAWAALAAGGDAGAAWRGLLVAFLFTTPLAAGLVVWSAVVALFHGRWDAGIERWPAAGVAFAPLSLAAYVVLWLGRGHWAAWLTLALPGQEGWFNETFVFWRDFGGLALLWALAWWYVRRREAGRPGALAPALALAYACVMTILSFDLMMSLDPRWYSTLFGG